MIKKRFISALPLIGMVAACGEPLTQAQVVQKFSNHTVTKTTSEKQLNHLGPNNPSLGQRHIYHASNGSAYYFKSTPKGYRRGEAGRWWAGEDKICYSMRVTRAEDPEGDQCAPAGTEVAWSSFEQGDTKKLVPRRAPARSGGSDIGFTHGDVALGLGVLLAGAAAVAGVAQAACGGPCPSSAATSAPSGPARQAGTGSASAKPAAAAPSGYKIFSTIPYGPGQSVVARGKCNGGYSFNVRYHPNNNPQYYINSLGGSSVADVAGRFCK